MSIGVLLNPIAGFGGALALHGTDALSPARFGEALAAGHAGRRLVRALRRFRESERGAALLAAPGVLGADALRAAGLELRATAGSGAAPTTRDDTIAAARRLVDEGADAILFAGGDGTATDLAEAIGERVPVVGVPAGVKMHSEVFARSPEGAGRLLADFCGGRATLDLAEVLDAAEDAAPAALAALLVPRSSEPLQGAKSAGRLANPGSERAALAHALVREALDGTTWVVGPGTTAGAVAEHLGFQATLRGVDVRHPDGTVEADVDEARLAAIVCTASQPRLVLGVVGGQGFLLGRGNQQISTRVVTALGADRIDIVATTEKVAALTPSVLLVDVDEDAASGAAGAAHPMLGYRRVRTGSQHSTVMRVIDAAADARATRSSSQRTTTAGERR